MWSRDDIAHFSFRLCETKETDKKSKYLEEGISMTDELLVVIIIQLFILLWEFR